jgi:hypothetical protein
MSAFEKHYTPAELGQLWGYSDTKIRRMFKDELGVVLDGTASARLGRKLKRRYFTMRIPASVAARVHERLTNRGRR